MLIMNNITLRIHHIVCMQSFIGKGYSEKFVQNFHNIIQFLRANPLCKCITLVNHCDDLCKYCPNRLNSNNCKNEQFIHYLDTSYQNILQINYEIKYSLNEINNILKGNLNIKTFNTICNNCQWFDICNKLIKNII